MSQEGGGGHGASWIVTYSDMITLLMTLFIVIVTFGSKEQDKHSKKLDSVVGGKGGTGVAGAEKGGTSRDSIMLRVSPLGRMVYKGSETPPMYSDPYPDPGAAALHALEDKPMGKLSDNFAFRVSMSTLFQADGKLSKSGTTFLQVLANSVRALPYDIQVQVGSKDQAASASRVTQYLFQSSALYPSRMSVAICPNAEPKLKNEMLLVLLRNR